MGKKIAEEEQIPLPVYVPQSNRHPFLSVSPRATDTPSCLGAPNQLPNLARAFTATPSSPKEAFPCPPPAGISMVVFVSVTGQGTCLFIHQPVMLLSRPHGNSPGSPAPSQGTAQNLSLPSPGLCWEPRQRERQRAGRGQRPAARLRMLGLSREPPTARHPGSCGWAGGRPWAQQSPTHGLGEVAWSRLDGGGPPLGLGLARFSASWPCPPTQASLRPPSRAALGPGATCQPHGCPTPTVLRACAPAKPQLPLQLPQPTVDRSPFQAPAHPQSSFQNAAANCQPPSFLSPGSYHHSRPPHQGSAFQTFPRDRGQATPAVCLLGWDGVGEALKV